MVKYWKEIIKNLIFGKKDKPYSLSKQLSRVITCCCVVAIIIQSMVLVGMVIKQYVKKGMEDTSYILKNDNGKMETKFQYLQEMVLTIQHNQGLRVFLKGQFYNDETVTKQLENVVNVFSERNRMGNAEPFVEKIYIYNINGGSICELFYPITVAEYNGFKKKYENLYNEFVGSKRDFYYKTEAKNISLCLNLYDETMNNIGVCIFVLNRQGIEDNYANLNKVSRYSWGIRTKSEIIISESNLFSYEKNNLIEQEFYAGFGLTFYAELSNAAIFGSLWSSILITFMVSVVLIIALTIFSHLISLRYVKPLKTIAKKIKQVGGGDFKTKLEDYRIEELKNISETFNDMTDYINKLIVEVYENQLIAKQSELQYVQAQMNPHFLYNVLSMIGMKAALNNDKEVQELIHKLSKLYQGKIFRKNEPVILLSEEMEIIDFYLSIQNSRFGDKITYSIEYEEGKEFYSNLSVPRLSIEPIVENAVCHGLEPKNGDGHISVNIGENAGNLMITVIDDGIGFDADAVEKESNYKGHTHVGLLNTDRMIKNLYGEEFGINIKSKSGVGTKVTITLPICKEEDECGR